MSMADFQQKTVARLPPLATLMMVAVVTPAFFYLGPVLLTPSRLILFVATPIIFFRLLSGAYGGVLLNDVLMFMFTLWMSLAMVVNNPDRAIEFLGMQITTILGSYLVARATITSKENFYGFVKLYVLIIVVLFPFAVFEAVTGGFIIPKILSALPGISSATDVHYERRLGLDRAQVVFTHPIHWGLYCSGAFALLFTAMKNVIPDFRRLFLCGVIVAACFMAVSSGPMLSLIFQLMLIGYGFVTRKIEKQWKLLLWGCAAAYVVLELASSYPIVYVMVTKIALDPWTATYRGLIFIYGMAQVEQAPILGIGLDDWERPAWMPPSIDNHWLLMAIQFGIPAFVMLFAVFVNSMARAGGGRFRRGSELYNIRLGWNFVLFSLILTLATVALFGELTAITFFILGAGGFLFYAEEDDPTVEKRPEAPRRRAVLGDIAAGAGSGAPPAPVAPAPAKGRRTVL
ncbi:MAG: O-antigen ligase family protein [Pikeienuella sp.]